ncbi:MAG TPA: DUF3305 domain-containing protein [Hyphomicrobiaceae bacterium]|nr:DUF3305 domain-containing protein [Hyphomicrobiaceae bacterium]
MSSDERSTSLAVGVVLVRENTDHAWQDHTWRPLEVIIGVSDHQPGDVLMDDGSKAHYFAGTTEIELHRKETGAYTVSLENEPPCVYVVICEDDNDDAVLPYKVRLVTISPFEAQDFLDTGEEIVEAIPMSAPLVAWVETFVANHHVEEKFIKRQRDRLNIRAEKFGQEPIAETRPRHRRSSRRGPHHDA